MLKMYQLMGGMDIGWSEGIAQIGTLSDAVQDGVMALLQVP